MENPDFVRVYDDLNRRLVQSLSDENIHGVANNWDVDNQANLDSPTLKSILQNKVPLMWLAECILLCRTRVSACTNISIYTTDVGMAILHKIRKGTKLNLDEEAIVQGINVEISQFPRPPIDFVCFRGFNGSPQLTKGQIYITNRPTSGSFSVNIITESYVHYDTDTSHKVIPGSGKSIGQIIVPAGSEVGFHRSEFQVVFPTGSTFEVLDGPIMKNWYSFDEYDGTETFIILYRGLSQNP